MKKIIILTLSSFGLSSCKIIHTLLIDLPQTSAKIRPLAVEGKQVFFIPMHHIGKKEFYEDVAQKIKEYKAGGYVVYYEGIAVDRNLDSLAQDSIYRKRRKILGRGGKTGGAMHSEVAKGTFLEKYIPQPAQNELGISRDNDIRADIYHSEFVLEFERLYGTVSLSKEDWSIALDSIYKSEPMVPDKKLRAINRDFRNKKLATAICQSPYKNILIIYGSGHYKGLKKELKRLQINTMD